MRFINHRTINKTFKMSAVWPFLRDIDTFALINTANKYRYVAPMPLSMSHEYFLPVSIFLDVASDFRKS